MSPVFRVPACGARVTSYIGSVFPACDSFPRGGDGTCILSTWQGSLKALERILRDIAD